VVVVVVVEVVVVAVGDAASVCWLHRSAVSANNVSWARLLAL